MAASPAQPLNQRLFCRDREAAFGAAAVEWDDGLRGAAPLWAVGCGSHEVAADGCLTTLPKAVPLLVERNLGSCDPLPAGSLAAERGCL